MRNTGTIERRIEIEWRLYVWARPGCQTHVLRRSEEALCWSRQLQNEPQSTSLEGCHLRRPQRLCRNRQLLLEEPRTHQAAGQQAAHRLADLRSEIGQKAAALSGRRRFLPRRPGVLCRGHRLWKYRTRHRRVGASQALRAAFGLAAFYSETQPAALRSMGRQMRILHHLRRRRRCPLRPNNRLL